MSATTKILGFNIYNNDLINIDFDNLRIINTINPHSYVVSLKDADFKKALQNSDVLLPDGIGIVWAASFLNNNKIAKIAGYDLFIHLLKKLDSEKGSCFFLGSSKDTLEKINTQMSKDYPGIKVEYFSPPFKTSFSLEENQIMIDSINRFKPDVLFVGMTAPKQEKWVFVNSIHIQSKVICSIGAVFDFYAGNVKRAPNWVIGLGLEWLHRSLSSWRLAKRNILSNPKFIFDVLKYKLKGK